jgi:glucan phosphoethanolaminetransferase (alkaline phosphatase superfamily)
MRRLVYGWLVSLLPKWMLIWIYMCYVDCSVDFRPYVYVYCTLYVSDYDMMQELLEINKEDWSEIHYPFSLLRAIEKPLK